MKKTLLLLVAVMFVAAGYLNAQVLYQDDFESYTAGDGIADQEGTWWNTWSGTPGSAEDPTVSDAFFYEGAQSVLVSGTNDGVIEFADLTTGRYRVEFYIMVPAGKLGYYNIMQNFNAAGTGLVWGMQVFLEDGTMSIDGAGEAEVTHTYTPGTWMKVQHFIDLNSDWVDMYIDDVLIHAYQWSLGTFDDGSGINKLDAFNFYAWDNGGAGTPEYYMDNFLIEEVETPYPPTNFAYTIENGNDVVFTWDAPSVGTPESYSVVRNGVTVGSTDLLTLTDVNVYPNTYEYQLVAFYGTSSGYSPSATPLNVTIDGGNARELVVFEMFTGTWCGYCPTAAQAIDLMADEGLDVAIIEYHGGDGYELSFTAEKEAYYLPFYDEGDPGFGYPTTIFNGEAGMEGALPTVADQNAYYDYFYDDIIDNPAVYTIDTWLEPMTTSPYVFNLHLDVEETFPYFADETRLIVALTETHIPDSWEGGLEEVNFVLRNMYPDGNGTIMDFSTETIHSDVIPISIDPAWAVDNCEVVIYVQNTATGHIQQAAKVGLYTFVNSDIEKTFATTVFPNPANDVLNIVAAENINSIEVLNMTGQVISVLSVDSDVANINVANYAAGVYFIKVYTANKVSTHKVIVE